MPEFKDAKISGFSGKGYVEVSTQEGVKRYNGEIEMDRDALTELGNRQDVLEFEGFMEDDLHQYRVVLPIRITRFDTPTRALFEGVAGPKELKPLDLENVEE